MQVIAAPGSSRLLQRLAIVRGFMVGALLLVVGGALAWVVVSTPVISDFIPSGRPTPIQVVLGIAAWGFAIVMPAVFAIMGIVRLASAMGRVGEMEPRRFTASLARALGPDHLAAANLVLPDGRPIHEVVLGPFGLVVLGDVPPRQATRHHGTYWEARIDRNRWIPIEDPVHRATRDAERVRSWLAMDDRDFLVRVYAAIVTTDATIQRSAECAVLAPEQLGGWLEALPEQRGLTPQRRERLEEMLRSLGRASVH